VTVGYLHRPELTAKKFVEHSFAGEPPVRLYHTGDLARYLPDGNIEFLGRVDHQVKIRGFRIELGEIETVLEQHAGVKKTAVLAREDSPGDKRLAAYVIPEEGAAPTNSDLRSFLKEKLPNYMIPSSFVFLEAMPLMPNGKVDRQALPAPDWTRPELEQAFVAPRTPVEEILTAIWTKVLGLERVGIHDNFFELGGDSILSIQILAQANQAGLQLVPRQLFEHQIIAELAAVANSGPTIQAEQGIVTGAVPLTPIQHWFFERNLPEPHHFNQSALLEMPPDVQPEWLEQAVRHLMVHHDALRMRYAPKASGWQQTNALSEDTVPFSVVDLSAFAERDRRRAFESTCTKQQASLSLSTGPVLSATLFAFGPDTPNRLLLVAHHLVVDGVSWRILLEDLYSIYQQLSRNQAVRLPLKTTSFKQWACRLKEYAQSEALAAELDYWLAQHPPGAAPLPVDHPSGRTDNTVRRRRACWTRSPER